jgi:predicted DNA-binding antitoxin AbrB/MazE fold protein
MTRVVRAIYEKGLFRPLDPVTEVVEGSCVALRIEQPSHPEAAPTTPLSAEELRRLIRSKNPDIDVPENLWEELERAIQAALSNVRDPKIVEQAADRMDRLRAEIYRRHGLLDLALPLLRESRDGE